MGEFKKSLSLSEKSFDQFYMDYSLSTGNIKLKTIKFNDVVFLIHSTAPKKEWQKMDILRQMSIKLFLFFALQQDITTIYILLLSRRIL